MSPTRPLTSTADADTARRLHSMAGARDDEAFDQYRWLFEHAHDAFVICDPSARILEMNPAAAALLEGVRAGLNGAAFTDVVEVEDRRLVGDQLMVALADGASRIDGVRLGSGRAAGRPVSASVARFDLQGEVRLALILWDVGGQRRVEESLKASRQRFRSLVRSVHDMVFTLGPDGRYDAVYGQLLGVPGWTPETFLTQRPDAIFPPDVAETHRLAADKAFAGEPTVYEWSMLAGEERRWLQTSLSPVHDIAGDVVSAVGITRDISSLRRLEQQVRMADRMASAGLLAAGVAHEINNPLATVAMNLDLASSALQAAMGGDSTRLAEVAEELRAAIEAADRVRLLVRDLKVFSRSEEEVRAPVDVRRVVDSTTRLAWNEVRHRARLVKDLETVPPALAVEGRLSQVILNLLVNAAQAIPDGDVENNEIRVCTRSDGDRVVITVTDTGPGIPPKVLRRLFDPFFTTKPPGEGTGLGLSICHRIVHDLGGTIEVESELGVGSTFRVALPVAAGDVAPRVVRTTQPTPARVGKLLVVDDEARLVEAVTRALEQDGHEIRATQSPRQALEWVMAGERFDLILSDLMMPQISGMDLHTRINDADAEQASRMVFLTGGAFTKKSADFLETCGLPTLEKPFRPHAVRALVNGLLR